MEPASFVLAVAGLPGVFTASVECFRYIRLGKHFGEDYGLCLAQLEAAEIRLLRWGEPMGLLEEDFDADALFEKGTWKEEEITKAKKWLGMIVTQFDKAKQASDEYEDIIAKSKDDLEIPDEAKQLAKMKKSMKRLIDWTKAISKKRQEKMSFVKKTEWALYRKPEFESLIEKVCLLTTNLVELFPMLEPRQKELCEEEVKTLPVESIPDLIKVIKEDDKMLNKAVAKESEFNGYEFTNVVFDGSGFARLGDVHDHGSNKEVKNLKVTGLKIGGSGYFQGGHHFGGPGSGSQVWPKLPQKTRSPENEEQSEGESEG